MYYVRGYFMKTVGVFEAKQQFEGVVAKVFDKGDHYVIQGCKFNKEQIRSIDTVSVNKETIDLPRLLGYTSAITRKRTPKKCEYKELAAQVKQKYRNLDFTIAVAEKSGKYIDQEMLTKLKEDVSFSLTLAQHAVKDKNKAALRYCRARIDELFDDVTYKIRTAKTAEQQAAEIWAMFEK